ncbi:MAG: sulfatase [Deltaproteobacteria bacterium]|nr:sulfatase [Deltaproteobacteria bacterium]
MTRTLIAAWIAAVLLAGCGGEDLRKGESSPPNVLLYVADTLRADSLPLYGGSKVETPALDAMARDAVVFDKAYATSSWTRASVASVLTGLHPEAHGARTRNDVLSESMVLLPEVFSQHGYRTAAIVTNPNVGATYGFRQGFDEFIELFGRHEREMVHQQTARGAKAAEVEFVDSDEVTRRAIEWIDAGPAPFFLFILSIDPHWPYEPPAGFDRYGGGYSGRVDRDPDVIFRRRLSEADRARIRSLYHGEIAFNDDSLGKLLGHLRAAGSYDDTAIVFTSDHGEEFWDHGSIMHGKTLYEEAIRVPLVIRHPGRMGAATRVTQPVELTDISATLLALAGLPLPYELDGRSLVGGPGADDRSLYQSVDLDEQQLQSIIDPPWKLIRDRRSGKVQLYDLEADAGESRNVGREQRGRTAALVKALADRASRSQERYEELQRGEAPRQVRDSDLSQEDLDELRALGYIREEDAGE